MFTGIIEHVGRVETLERGAEVVTFEIEAGPVSEGVPIGASVAVNGACLTVTRVGAGVLAFDAIPETLERTALGSLGAGSSVNLERALRADGRLDGHIVQGHVDATGEVAALERRGDDVRFAVRCAPEFAAQLVPKGSVAIDGVSLTLVGVEPEGFDVALIPHTLRETTLGSRAVGDPVNLEADILGKYVLRYLERVAPGR